MSADVADFPKVAPTAGPLPSPSSTVVKTSQLCTFFGGGEPHIPTRYLWNTPSSTGQNA